MNADDQAITDQAIAWHARLRDGDAAQWEAFVLWLEQDPRHALAYDEVEQADAGLDGALPALCAAGPADAAPASPRHRWRWVAGGAALAASVTAAIVLVPQFRPVPYEVATRGGEVRTIRVDGSTSITLNGATRLVLDRHDARSARLIVGEALFHVRHDAQHPFTLIVGDNSVRDLGTVFNVVERQDEVEVAVAEGSVSFGTGSGDTTLRAGQALTATAAGTATRQVAAATIGGWRTGRLTYSAAPLSQVAADISRRLGQTIDVAPVIAHRPFSGTIVVRQASDAERRRLAAILDVQIRATASTWIMEPVAAHAH